MTTLVQLKSQHPEWCFSCGKWWLEAEGLHTCHEHPLVAALLAKALEDEVKIASYINTLQSIASALGARIGSDLSELPDHANGITAKIAAQEAEIAANEEDLSNCLAKAKELDRENTELRIDSVPRSRYRAVEKEADDARARITEIQKAAHTEIDSLTSQLTAERLRNEALEEKLANWKAHADHLQAQFQRETLRTGEQYQMLVKWMKRNADKGCSAEPWAKDDCLDCTLMRETKELLERPINVTREEARKKGAEHGE